MLRRPPPFPLFPYTTLFRSEVQPRIVAAQVACRVVDLANLRPASGIHAHRDRKSTRLNSSHLVISYAVFCLKKTKRRSTSVRSPLKRSTLHQSSTYIP